MNVFTLSQTQFRFYEDGTEAGSVAIANQNTNITRTVNSNSNLLLRVMLDESGAIDGLATDDYQLQVSKNGGAYANVNGGTANVQGFNSANLTEGNATTSRLTGGVGTFVAGKIAEDGLVDNLQITASNFTDLLFAITIVAADVADNDTLDFRVLLNGGTITYSVTPRITVDKLAVFNESITETASAAESITVTGSFSAGVTETGSASDSSTPAVSTSASGSETAAASDSLSGNAAYAVAILESLGLGYGEGGYGEGGYGGAGEARDSSSAELVVPITETASAADTQDSSTSYNAAMAESATASESSSVTVIKAAEAAEIAAATEALIAALITAAARTESSPASESQSATRDAVASQAESATAAETQSALKTADAAITETGSAADTQSATKDHAASQSESATATESQTGQVDAAAMPVEESVTASETQSASADYSVARVESGAAAETQSLSTSTNAAQAESSPASESQTATQDRVAAQAETATATEAQTLSTDTNAAQSESGAASEAQTAVTDKTAAIAESGTASEEQTAIRGHNPAKTETVERTNYALQSETLDHADWVKVNVTVDPDVEANPDTGAVTMDLLVATGANGEHCITQSPVLIDGRQVLSANVKASGYGWVVLAARGGSIRCSFNLTSGTVGTAINCTGAIVDKGNGVYLCSILFTP